MPKASIKRGVKLQSVKSGGGVWKLFVMKKNNKMNEQDKKKKKKKFGKFLKNEMKLIDNYYIIIVDECKIMYK